MFCFPFWMILTSKIFISQTQNWIFFRNPSVLLAFKSKRLWPKFCGIYETIVVNDSWYFFKRPGGLESSLVRHIFCLFYIDVKTPSSCHHKIWIIEIAQDKNIIALTSVAFFSPVLSDFCCYWDYWNPRNRCTR